MSAPAVSVLLPYRNAAATLEDAIRSVLADDGVALELIAVDDGSVDTSARLVAGIAARDGRVRMVSSGGAGIVAALNLGARHARGEFLGRMDADDVSIPGRFATLRGALAADGTLGVVGSRVEAFPESLVLEGLRRYVTWQNSLLTPEQHARELFVESPLCHPSVVIRRAAFEDVGGYREGPFPEDYDLWLRLAAKGYGIAKVPQVLLRWRHGDARLTFSDPRYSHAAFRALKAFHLAKRLRPLAPVVVWGAGPTGRRFARELQGQAVPIARFIDIDPRKIGRTARGVPIESQETLRVERAFVIVAVGARDARERIRKALADLDYAEEQDYLCVA